MRTPNGAPHFQRHRKNEDVENGLESETLETETLAETPENWSLDSENIPNGPTRGATRPLEVNQSGHISIAETEPENQEKAYELIMRMAIEVKK